MKRLLTRIAEIRFPELWMPAALYVPLGALLVVLSVSTHPRPLGSVAALFLAGLAAWTLIEYGLHRFVFHWTTAREPWRSLTSAFHMSHHEAVTLSEPDYVITRPAGSLPFAVVFYFVFALITWSFSAAALIEAGVFAGYLLYECVHFSVHRFQPKDPVGRSLRRYHLQHHFRFPDSRFGVTSPFWDLVFRTY